MWTSICPVYSSIPWPYRLPPRVNFPSSQLFSWSLGPGLHEVKTDVKKSFGTSAFSMSCVNRSSTSFSSRTTFSPVFLLPSVYLKCPLLLLFTLLTTFHPTWALPFWTLSTCSDVISVLLPGYLSLLRQNHRITESQNHRMVGVGRDLCGSSSPTVLLKQGHLQEAAQDLVQTGLEYLQRRRLQNLPGQPVPVLRHPQREEVLTHVQTELPVLQFVPIAPCPTFSTPPSYLWIVPRALCSSIQASWYFCLTSCLLGWTNIQLIRAQWYRATFLRS